MGCLTPYVVKVKKPWNNREQLEYETPVPCGKCPECRARRASGWSFRIMQQDKIAKEAHFVTLTYDTAHVPLTRSNYMDLCKEHLQGYIKRLRYYYAEHAKEYKTGTEKISYYACGEYGGQTDRPHYHLIIFNATEKAITKAWEYGTVFIGTVTGASVAYSLKYLMKPGRIPMHKNDDRHKEFCLFSKKLGANYVNETMIEWHKRDLTKRMYCTLPDGQKISMPRYYKEIIYDDNERQVIGVAAKIEANTEVEKLQKELGKDYHKIMAGRHLQAFRRMNDTANKNNKI